MRSLHSVLLSLAAIVQIGAMPAVRANSIAPPSLIDTVADVAGAINSKSMAYFESNLAQGAKIVINGIVMATDRQDCLRYYADLMSKSVSLRPLLRTTGRRSMGIETVRGGEATRGAYLEGGELIQTRIVNYQIDAGGKIAEITYFTTNADTLGPDQRVFFPRRPGD